MSLRAFVAALAAGFIVFFIAHRASAQSISITNKAGLFRFDSTSKNQISPHPDLNPLGVNLQDCREDQRLRFVVTMAQPQANDTVEVWATDQGADCGDTTARSAAIPRCYKIDVTVPVTATNNVDIPVKAVLRGIPTEPVDADGCRRLISKSAISVQFLYFRGSNTGAATVKDDATVNVKTQGPPPLGSFTVKPGNQNLQASFEAVGEGGVADVTKVYAYCDRAPIAGTDTTTTCDDASADAETGADGEAGADAGCRETTTGGDIPAPSGLDSNGVACGTKPFLKVDGKRITPDSAFDALYRCGEAGGPTATSITAGPVENNTIVAVAIAAVDSFGNIGELSDPLCQYGEQTTDFWNNYRGAGGESGGGFCSVNGPGMPASSGIVLGIAVALAVSIARKKGSARR